MLLVSIIYLFWFIFVWSFFNGVDLMISVFFFLLLFGQHMEWIC